MPSLFRFSLLVGLVLVLAGCASPTQLPTPTAKLSRVSSDIFIVDGRTKGNPNAKVTLVIYSDFQCPYCRQFWRDVEPRIESDYIKTGKISYTYKYFPVIDKGKIGESHWAAYGAECANEQNKFWEFQDKLFAEWYGENVGAFTLDKLKIYATEMKLDTTKFNACLDSNRHAPLVLEHLTEALQLRLPGTPYFLLNGRRLNTPTLDYAEFWKPIEEELKAR